MFLKQSNNPRYIAIFVGVLVSIIITAFCDVGGDVQYVYLDDKRDVPSDVKDWKLVRSPVEFMDMILQNHHTIKEISFDNDLWVFKTFSNPKDTREISGESLLLWTIETYKQLGSHFPKIKCHSANPVQQWRFEVILEEAMQRFFHEDGKILITHDSDE